MPLTAVLDTNVIIRLSLKQFRLIDYQVQIVEVAKFAELLELQSTRT